MPLSPESDPYAVLGVAADADEREIKRAFRTKARECHPDVAGASPEAAERFRRIRSAYETLIDPKKRARVDRRARRRAGPTTGPVGFDGSNDLDLEDIFGDHGGFADFGFGAGTPGRRGPRGAGGSGYRGGPSAGAQDYDRSRPGADIRVQVDVPEAVAREGGSVSVSYRRVPPGGGRERDEIASLRLGPGTREGEVVTIPRMGHAGTGGGRPGDLLCTVRILRSPRSEWRGEGRASGHAAGRGQTAGAAVEVAGTREDPAVLSISVAEALLGGRVEVETPGGKVAVAIRPCTPGGSLLRLKGKGRAAGAPGLSGTSDWYVRLHIVPPEDLDEESRALIEQFARLNPGVPR
jgi:DnaJ-class molecular chaperone